MFCTGLLSGLFFLFLVTPQAWLGCMVFSLFFFTTPPPLPSVQLSSTSFLLLQVTIIIILQSYANFLQPWLPLQRAGIMAFVFSAGKTVVPFCVSLSLSLFLFPLSCFSSCLLIPLSTSILFFWPSLELLHVIEDGNLAADKRGKK